MCNSNHKSNTLNQPVTSNFIGQKTLTHNSPVLTNKEITHQKVTCSAVKRSNEEHSPVEGNAAKKNKYESNPTKNIITEVNKRRLGIDPLHEIQLLRNAMNNNHSELSTKVDSTTTELKSVQ